MDLYNVRSGIQGALQGASGSGWALYSGRVVLGYYPLTGRASGQEWFANLRTGASGGFAEVGPGALARDDLGDNGHPVYSVTVDLWLALPAKDAAHTLQSVAGFLEVLRAALAAVFIAGVTWDEPEVLLQFAFPVLHYKLLLEVQGCG